MIKPMQNPKHTHVEPMHPKIRCKSHAKADVQEQMNTVVTGVVAVGSC